jgi:peptidyl-prolyl cis-trans isomerase SurA
MRLSFLLYLSLIFNLATSTPAMAIEEMDSIAIIVNDEVITRQQIENRFNDFKQQILLQGQSLPDDELLKKQVIERMIVDSIQLQMAKLQGISLDDLSLNQALESIAKNNNTTLDGLRRTLTSKGISYENFREQTRRDIIIQQLQQRAIYSTVKVSPQEIDIFLEQQKQSGDQSNDKYHLAHILIATPEAASPEEVTGALNKAKQAIERIEKGENFSDVALRFSDGRQALQGGDLEWRSAAELPPLFLNTARQLEKGEVSRPLRSASGFHILKLIDKQTRSYLVQQTHARHILIKTDQITSDTEARDTLLSIKQRLNEGEDFAALAEEYSQDPGSKNNGGDLGWASEGSFVPRFTQVMNSLNKGEISEPFKSQFGWHILQVLDRRKEDETEQRIRQKAEKAIQKRKADEELQLWLRRSRDEAYVEFINENGN